MTRSDRYFSDCYSLLKGSLFFLICLGALCFIAPTLAQERTPTPEPTPTPAPARPIRRLLDILVQPRPTPTPTPPPSRPDRNFPIIVAEPTPTPEPSPIQMGPIRTFPNVNGPLTQANLPKTLTFLTAAGPSGSSVILKNVQYSNPDGSAGKGDLSITLSGIPLAVVPGSVFEDVSAEPDGTVTAGSVTLGNDVPAADLFESGVDLVFQGNGSEYPGKITVRQAGTSALFTSGIRMRLPYFTASGEQAEVNLAELVYTSPNNATVHLASFLLNADGGFAISTQASYFYKPAKDDLKIAGFTIDPETEVAGLKGVLNRLAAINFAHPGSGGKLFDLTVTMRAKLTTFIPNLLTQDDGALKLVTENLVLNEDGVVSFDADGTDPFLWFQNPGFTFAKPMDFAMAFHPGFSQLDVSYSSDHFTKFSMTGDLRLPTSVSGKLSGVTMNLNSNQKWDVTPGNEESKVRFGTDPKALYELKIQSYSVDLSGDGRVSIKAGELSGGIFGAGQTVMVNDGDLYIDTFGVTGSVHFPPNFKSSPKVGGFDVTVTADPNSKLEFKQNASIGESNLAGQVVLGDMGTLFVRVYRQANGTTVITVDPDKPLTTLSLNKYKVGLAVSAVALSPKNEVDYNLGLTGALTFSTASFANLPAGTATAEVALPFTDLGLDAVKGFTTSSADGFMSLDNPVDLELGLFKLNVSQFRFPDSTDDAIKLTGAVKLSTDLPLSGALDFTGLKIAPGGSLDFGKITFTNLTLMDVATINGSLTRQDMSGKSYLVGDVSLKLNFAGDMGGKFQFLVGNGSWLVMGLVHLPYSAGSGIPLGSSGFALYGFRGGLGHNVTFNPMAPNFNPTSISNFTPTANGNSLFMAGVRVGTADAFLLWGDATLTVTSQPLLINLNLAANLLEPMKENPTGDRTAIGNMTYNSGNGSFRTTAQVDAYFPTKALSIAEAHGGADLLISKDDTHVRIGWPPSKSVGVKILGVGGLSGGLAFGPGKNFGANFFWGVDLYFIKGEIDGYLLADMTKGLVLVGVLHASGEIDFIVFSASAEAMLQAHMQTNPKELDLYGKFRGCIGVWPFGHSCITLGPKNFHVP